MAISLILSKAEYLRTCMSVLRAPLPMSQIVLGGTHIFRKKNSQLKGEYRRVLLHISRAWGSMFFPPLVTADNIAHV